MNDINNENSITFVMPVVFNSNRINIELHCIDLLSKQLSLRKNPKLFVIGDNKNLNFINWKPNYEFVVKILTNESLNVSKSLNMIAKGCLTKYFCFVHSDVEMKDNDWINKFIKLDERLNSCGVIGIQAHSDCKFYLKKIEEGINEVLTVSGVMFLKTDLLKLANYFDEIYVGDCTDGELCLKLFSNGYKNYVISNTLISNIHHRIPFQFKTDDTEQLLKFAKESNIVFKKRWDDFIQKIKNNNATNIISSNNRDIVNEENNNF